MSALGGSSLLPSGEKVAVAAKPRERPDEGTPNNRMRPSSPRRGPSPPRGEGANVHGPCKSIRRMLAAFALAALATVPLPARAALAPADLDAVGIVPAPGAALPRGLPFVDQAGRAVRLGDLLGARPIVLVLLDYRCREICGPILAVTGSALSRTGLEAGRDFDLLAIGLDPAASPADAARMRDAQLAGLGAVASSARLLGGTPQDVARLEAAIGYHAAYDGGAGRYAHPVDILVLTPGGAVSRVLPGLAPDPATLRLALVEAGEGRIGTLGDRLHLLCYGLDPAHGLANRAVAAMLTAGGLLTLAGLGGFLLVLSRRRGGMPEAPR